MMTLVFSLLPEAGIILLLEFYDPIKLGQF